MADAPDMRWWGWGRPGHASTLSPHALAWLRETIGTSSAPAPAVALDRVVLPPSALTPGAHAALAAAVGSDHLRGDHAQRVLHAAGKSYMDLIRLRQGRPDGAPDVVVYPSDERALRAMLDACAEHDVAVVPFGGGTSVVGGVAPLRGGHAAVAAVDLRRLDGLSGLDRLSGIVTCAAGRRVASLEAELGAVGLTLGHFPQSYEYVSLGGCAATRSAGQSSTGYGRFEDMVLGLRCVTPTGEMALPAVPASAAGPDLRELVVGSEGTLGIISELTLRVRRAPEQRVHEGLFFETFAGGVEGLRLLAAHDARPDVARLSDADETRLSMMLADRTSITDRAGSAYLSARGYGAGCLAILGFEGEPAEIEHRRRRATVLLRRAGALRVGRGVGEAWAAARFAGPYLRDDLLIHGVMVETLETATGWGQLTSLHGSVSGAIRAALGTAALVMAHVSHVYASGASLYFTFLARRQEGAELEQWQAAKRAASAVIVAHGATITHHHAVGRDHAPWLGHETGTVGISALRAVKAELDPAGLMNPGKLLDG